MWTRHPLTAKNEFPCTTCESNWTTHSDEKHLYQSFASTVCFCFFCFAVIYFTIKYLLKWLQIWMPYFRRGCQPFTINPRSNGTVQFAYIQFSLKVFPIAVVRCNCEILYPSYLIIHGALYSLSGLSVLWRCDSRVSLLQCMPGIPENWKLH